MPILPLLQEPALYDSSVFASSGNDPSGSLMSGLGFTYPSISQPGPMPAGFGPIRTLAGPQGPQGPQDAFAPFAGIPLSGSDSSPEGSRAAGNALPLHCVLSVVDIDHNESPLSVSCCP